MPVHEIEDVLERDRPVSRVRLFTLHRGAHRHRLGLPAHDVVVAASGGSSSAASRPWLPIPPYVVIAFELTILFGGLATLIGMVMLGRLPRFRPHRAYDPRFTNDRFGVAVHCAPDRGAVGAARSSRRPAPRRSRA